MTDTRPLETILSPDDIKHLTDTSQLAQPYRPPILKATFKQTPQDFEVTEVLDIKFSGKGEHLWMLIKKTGMNTSYVAEQLAKWAKISSRDVGYSGLKDRHAVTTQWFSLRLPKKELPATTFSDFIASTASKQPTSGQSHHHQSLQHQSQNQPTESIEILKQVWHSKKLNRGTHDANHFVIVLRDIEFDPDVASNQKAVDELLNVIKGKGVPNYFGEQRFGRNGSNIADAVEWFEHGTINGRKPHPKKSRDRQSIILSSARSAIFNQILSKRVAGNSWYKGLDGDVFNLDGSGSVFATEQLDDELRNRLATGDIHPTGPLWGINNDKVTGAVKALEEAVIKENPVLQRLAQGLETKQIKTMRRALRMPISDLDWSWNADGLNTHSQNPNLKLSFSLPTGSFATSVLASLVQLLQR